MNGVKEKNEDIISTIFLSKFNEECKSIEKNEDSSDGNVYIVECNERKYVVKIYDNEKHLKLMVDIHTKLLKDNVNVPEIVYSICDTKKDIYVVVYSFIEGTQIKNTLKDGKVEEKLIADIARTIRKMHNTFTGINEFNLPELEFDTYQKRKTVIHFDLTKDNIFLNNNGIYIIDFDDAKYGSAIYDIAILIATFFFSKSRGIDIDGMQKFINEYYGKDIDLKNEEFSVIKQSAIQWIDYMLKNSKLKPFLIDSFETKKKIINECRYI